MRPLNMGVLITKLYIEYTGLENELSTKIKIKFHLVLNGLLQNQRFYYLKDH